jgi:transcriptional regulator with XRE-family HTH domain
MASDEDYAAEEARLLGLLAEIAKQKRISIRAMEARAGVGVSVFSRIFSGKVRPSVRHILRICDVLELPWADFYALAHGAGPEPQQTDFERRVIAVLKRLGWEPPEGSTWPSSPGEP